MYYVNTNQIEKAIEHYEKKRELIAHYEKKRELIARKEEEDVGVSENIDTAIKCMSIVIVYEMLGRGVYLLKYLNKYEPIKPEVKLRDLYANFKCPVCEKGITAYQNECGECGQIIDWSNLNGV